MHPVNVESVLILFPLNSISRPAILHTDWLDKLRLLNYPQSAEALAVPRPAKFDRPRTDGPPKIPKSLSGDEWVKLTPQ